MLTNPVHSVTSKYSQSRWLLEGRRPVFLTALFPEPPFKDWLRGVRRFINSGWSADRRKGDLGKSKGGREEGAGEREES